MSASEKRGYITLTYRRKLYQKHLDWFELTKVKYNQVLEFYYQILLQQKELLELSNQNIMRQLELLTLGKKRNNIINPVYPFPFDKIPEYFRRAAINQAIGMVRSYTERRNLWENSILEKEQRGIQATLSGRPQPAKSFHSSPVYYKGMYKEFTKDTIALKLWTGEKWQWLKFTHQDLGRPLPENGKYMSPTICIGKNGVMLHIPVEIPVEDVRTIKERIIEKPIICAANFPKNNNLAVCALFDSEGKVFQSYFIKGGDQLDSRRNYYLGKIKRSKSYSNSLAVSEKYKNKITCLTDYYAHKVSKEIIDFCLDQHAKIIVVPDFGQEVSFSCTGYFKLNNYKWIGRRIITYLKYKAFQNGIIVTAVLPYYFLDRCSKCKESIKKYSSELESNNSKPNGTQYICPNGHKGDIELNAIINLGHYFLDRNAKELYFYMVRIPEKNP